MLSIISWSVTDISKCRLPWQETEGKLSAIVLKYELQTFCFYRFIPLVLKAWNNPKTRKVVRKYELVQNSET